MRVETVYHCFVPPTQQQVLIKQHKNNYNVKPDSILGYNLPARHMGHTDCQKVVLINTLHNLLPEHTKPNQIFLFK